MSYQVLARKWRPKNFSEVVGQSHVLTALENGLKENRLHHAYLFSGTRGVGKTSIARLFAKGLNCVNGITADPCGECENCKANLPYEQRLQLLDFLVNIAKSDGSVCSEEIAALKEVAQCMELSPKEVESMLNLSGNSLEEAYKVLEIDPSATNEEVRTAYRRLALKHHPDRVATLGEDVKKAAEEKFQQINNAKERIYKARGIK